MKSELSRRDFLASIGTVAFTATVRAASARALAVPSSPHHGKRYHGASLRYGYTAMTWGKDERQAIDDISALGFPGIQFRDNAITEFRPSELRDLLARRHLTMVALSSGEVDTDPAVEKEQLAMHVANAQYVRDAGGLYLQVLDKLAKRRPRLVTPEQCRQLGRLLTEIGKRTADLGIPLGYHNHMNTISERPGDLARVLEASDPRYVKLELDTAHYVGGGGNPAQAIPVYRDRLLFLHLKDMIDEPMGTESKQKYPVKFVELGRGRIDFPAIFAALNKIEFHGWAVIELDRVPDKSTTPKEAALISRNYLERRLGVNI